MSYRYERYERRRGRNGCLALVVALIWIALIGLVVYRFYLQPRVSAYLGSQIGQQLQQAAPDNPVQGQIAEQAGAALPTAIAALPAGEVRVTDDKINAYLQANADRLGPIDSAVVRFVPGEIQADLTVFGTTSTAHAGLVAQNGRVVAVNPKIDGPLGQVISLQDLARTLEDQVNAQLGAQGRRVTNVQIEQGAMVVQIEQ